MGKGEVFEILGYGNDRGIAVGKERGNCGKNFADHDRTKKAFEEMIYRSGCFRQPNRDFKNAIVRFYQISIC